MLSVRQNVGCSSRPHTQPTQRQPVNIYSCYWVSFCGRHYVALVLLPPPGVMRSSLARGFGCDVCGDLLSLCVCGVRAWCACGARLLPQSASTPLQPIKNAWNMMVSTRCSMPHDAVQLEVKVEGEWKGGLAFNSHRTPRCLSGNTGDGQTDGRMDGAGGKMDKMDRQMNSCVHKMPAQNTHSHTRVCMYTYSTGGRSVRKVFNLMKSSVAYIVVVWGCLPTIWPSHDARSFCVESCVGGWVWICVERPMQCATVRSSVGFGVHSCVSVRHACLGEFMWRTQRRRR